MSEDEARSFFESGQWDKAALAARQALRNGPATTGLWWMLALSERERGDTDAAVRAFEQLVQLEPELPEHWSNLATTLRDAGRLQDALATYGEAAKRGAGGASFHYSVAALLLDLQQPQDALEHLRVARDLSGGDAEICCLLGETLISLLRLEEAAELLRAWRSWSDLIESLLPRLSSLLLQAGELEQGAEVLRVALMVDPPDDDSQAQLVSLLERNNQLDLAQEKLRSWLLPATATAELKSQRDALAARLAQRRGEHVAAVQHFRTALLHRDDANTVDADLLFSLAKSQDSLGQAEACMETLARAHQAQVRDLGVTHPGLRLDQPFRIADYSVEAADVQRWQQDPLPDEPRSPLFVIAFPRSGTTLLEQSLDAHPSLRSMDEQPFLQKAIEDLQASGVAYPESMADVSTETLQEARRRYFTRVATRVQLQPGQRLVDKNPLNLLRLPAIRRLFPDAPVVLLQRHPCDVLLSCYMQPFRAPEFAGLCRTLETLAEAYAKAFRFFYAQIALLGTPVLELRYETLTEGLEDSTRRICELAGLPWDVRMLDPAGHALQKGYISTPSYHQVVQPLNRKAVNRWRRYERYFEPVLPALAPMLDRWGYR